MSITLLLCYHITNTIFIQYTFINTIKQKYEIGAIKILC